MGHATAAVHSRSVADAFPLTVADQANKYAFWLENIDAISSHFLEISKKTPVISIWPRVVFCHGSQRPALN
jgi:hypothetical protein